MPSHNVANASKWGLGGRRRAECVGELTMRPAGSKAMPKFHQDVFTDSEMRKVIAFLQSLGQQPRKGGRT
jgi:mono/diheme cytochrome c family protein